MEVRRVIRQSERVTLETPVLAKYTVLMTVNLIQCYNEERDGLAVPDGVMKILGRMVRRKTLPKANEELVWTYVRKKFKSLDRGYQGKMDMDFVKRQLLGAREARKHLAERCSIRETWRHGSRRWPCEDPETITKNSMWTLDNQFRYGAGMFFSYPARIVDEPCPSVWFHFRETETPTALLPVVVVNGKIVNWLRGGDGSTYRMRSFCVDAESNKDPLEINKVMFVYMFPDDLIDVEKLYQQTHGALGTLHVEFRSHSVSPRSLSIDQLPVVDVEEIVLPDSTSPRLEGEGFFVMDEDDEEGQEQPTEEVCEKPFLFVACGHALSEVDIELYRRFRECPECGKNDGDLMVVRTASPKPPE